MEQNCFIYEDVIDVEGRDVGYGPRFNSDLINLKDIVFHSFDNVFITDSSGRIVFMNDKAESMLCFCLVSPGSISIEECLNYGIYSSSTSREAMIKRKRVTGIVRTPAGLELLATSTPFFDAEGNVTYVLTNSREKKCVDNSLAVLLEAERHEKNRLRHAASYLNAILDRVVAESPAMRGVLSVAKTVAGTDSTVLITGETGTGKDVVAKFIHGQSPRKEEPFIPVNCAAIPPELLESEFFGYEKGAFTGAGPQGKPGLFEIADRGTLFLDEVGELPLHMQSKLLRALESSEIQRVGGTKRRKISVRILAATNQRLEEMVRAGNFREDLYYRLNVIPISIPPLSQRKEDILPLARLFLDEVGHKTGQKKRLSPLVEEMLLAYSWPGNIRELRNIMERFAIITEGSVVGPEMCRGVLAPVPERLPASGNASSAAGGMLPLREWRNRVESDYLRQAYSACSGNVSDMAKLLDVHKTGLYRKLRSIGLNA